eukprot:GGOE01042171.1.p3 GENE.GGOE01042171.1~~GGOE01042171.1.p3  ORF type:complete len:127 (-),score=24.56 GGOE01042171.1:1003-1359(-)
MTEFSAVWQSNQLPRPSRVRPPLRPISALRLAIPRPKASNDVEPRVVLGLLGLKSDCTMAQLRKQFINFSVPFVNEKVQGVDMERFLCLSMAYQNLMIMKRLNCGRKGFPGAPSACRP